MNGLMRMLAVIAVVALAAGAASAQAAPKPDNLIVKWSQLVDLEQGYDIYSFWPQGAPRPVTMVADDWRCPDGRPVTDVHWWGSYLGGGPQGLLGFKITIFSDIPPDGIHPSHPGTVLWDSYYTRLAFEEQVYLANGETIYQYNADLIQPFEQVQGQIYWLAIVGLVDNNTAWGWHTGVRPQPDNTLDDAVLILDYNAEFGTYLTYSELFDSQGSVAMAFELTTIPEPATCLLIGSVGVVLACLRRRSRKLAMLLAAAALTLTVGGSLCAQIAPPDGQSQLTKWVQPPDLLTGRDIYSFWSAGQDYPTVVVADDWRCLDGLPISDIHWWGSYPSGTPPVGAPGVLSFELSIHTDIPAVGNTPSHPGTLLWSKEYVLGQTVLESFFALDNNSEAVYQYDLLLPEKDWFYQEQGSIYWLDIIARTSSDQVLWGWHTATRPAPENGLDAAVMIYDYDPSSGAYTRWGPLYDFCQVPMAFALTTIPEPSTLALVGSAALMGLGVLRRRRMK